MKIKLGKKYLVFGNLFADLLEITLDKDQTHIPLHPHTINNKTLMQEKGILKQMDGD